MKYISTRGQAPAMNFEEVLLTGLASDGGLFVPESLPQFSKEEIASWAGLSYAELAKKIIAPFVAGTIPTEDLNAIIDETYGVGGDNSVFSHNAVAPLKQLDSNLWLLELFHGPTLAFKDFALQLLGRLLDYVLEKRKEKVVIVGATSGDTGSAAIEGCRRCDNVDIFILHPHNRVSDVQRKQMTTIIGDNIHNIAVEGNFDDCQQMVKQSFADQSFLKGRKLVAVNSINWARIMAQIVYYFHASLSLGGPHREVSFSVPTGNFGDIFAGYLARGMGLPVKQLVVATNSNDILHRCISSNDFSKKELVHTLSPSMDIMVSSNFERLLFDLYDRDGTAIDSLMSSLNKEAVALDPKRLEKARELFDSYSVDDDVCCQVIADSYNQTEELLDPHSAIGVKAGQECRRDAETPMIALATAHPVKFPEPVVKAGCKAPSLPHHLEDLFDREEAFQVLPNDLTAVQAFISKNID
ncbi:threonine synthase [Motiliproteus sp. MSK22-1]|uniref:threonine synthase n=1 Tax=Motiliproteus sp. MSK22-1 TaxID=1897630 RepID=UPI0009788B0F|nr:threonine synthase [Motiliproteus sp. MSK22-1]OMH35320.1 threonine synthase [Motiliproteus sp. MSK22-1]